MRLRELQKDGIMNKILNGFLLVYKLVKLCNISHLMLFLFINLIRCEEKWVFFNNETFFNVALLKLFGFIVKCIFFSGLWRFSIKFRAFFSCGMNILLELYFLRIELICALQEETIKPVSKWLTFLLRNN